MHHLYFQPKKIVTCADYFNSQCILRVFALSVLGELGKTIKYVKKLYKISILFLKSAPPRENPRFAPAFLTF